jgi:DNA-3-methyladenine glycosylase
VTNLHLTYPQSFYERNTVAVAKDLLGTVLCRRLPDGTVLQGQIVETEAYTQDDPACHAFRGKTKRCEVLFGPPGMAYVYFIYGMYFCLNVVTEKEPTAGAVLIRAVGAHNTNGPGKLCREWDIDFSFNGANLMDPASNLWISPGKPVPDADIEITSRVGISSAQDRLWRFHLKDHHAVSRGKPSYVGQPQKRRKTRA